MAAEGSAATPPAMELGSYVRIEGLQSGTQHNGRYGFVVGREGDRLSVVVAHADVVLNVKPANLVLETQDRTSRRHEVVMVYPNKQTDVRKPDASSMLVSAGESSPLRGWPSDWMQEMRWIRQVLGWKNPVCVSGVTRAASSKPDLMIYLDAASEHCLVNKHAQAAIARLPPWELQKVQNELPAKVRGAVILVYSPTISMTSGTQQFADDSLETSSDFQEQPSAGKLSLNDAAVALAYQHAAPRSTAAEQREMTIEQLMGAFSQ